MRPVRSLLFPNKNDDRNENDRNWFTNYRSIVDPLLYMFK